MPSNVDDIGRLSAPDPVKSMLLRLLTVPNPPAKSALVRCPAVGAIKLSVAFALAVAAPPVTFNVAKPTPPPELKLDALIDALTPSVVPPVLSLTKKLPVDKSTPKFSVPVRLIVLATPGVSN